MEGFLKELRAWQPFFITPAGVSATPAGLLRAGGISLVFSPTAPPRPRTPCFVFSGSVTLLIAAMRSAWFPLPQELG